MTAYFKAEGVTFLLAADTQAAYMSACEMSRRFAHGCVRACDLLLGIYHGSKGEVADILRRAIKDETRLDQVVIAHADKLMRDDDVLKNGMAASACQAFGTAAELGVFYRGLVAPNVAVISGADLGVALLNSSSVQCLLRDAGLTDDQLRHLEEAMRFQEKVPAVIADDSASAQPAVVH